MKIFETLFGINGVIKPGFQAMVSGGQKGLSGLGKSANDVGRQFAALAKSLLTIGAAYLGWKGISSFFREASAASERNAAINFKLLNTLRAQKGMQVAGVMNYQNQYNKLVGLSKELGKQGVLSAGHFKTAMATMATYGLTPNKIQKISKAIGDVAVQQHGINVSSEQMEGLAERWSRAIQTGNIRGLGPLVGHMTAAERAAWKKAKADERIAILLRAAERAAKDFNAEMAKTPEGKQAQFAKDWRAFITEVGDALRPFHGQVAEIKSALLGIFSGPVLAAVQEFAKIFRSEADEFSEDWEDSLLDVSELFSTESEFMKNIRELGDAFNNLGTALGIDWTKASAGLGELFARTIIDAINDTAKALNTFATAVERIKGLFGGIAQAEEAIMRWRQGLPIPSLGPKVAEGVKAESITRTFGRVEKAMYERGGAVGAVAAAMPRKPAWTPEEEKVQAVLRDQVPTLEALEEIYKKNVDTQNQVLAEHVADMATMQQVRDASERVGKSQEDLERAMAAAGTAAGLSADELQNLGSGVAAVVAALQAKAAEMAAIRIQAPTVVPGGGGAPVEAQEGGIFTRPTRALIGEAGAEAVIPLQRSRRGLSLLEAAAKAMGLRVPGWVGLAKGGNLGTAENLGNAMEELFRRTRLGAAPSAAARASAPLNYAPTLNFDSGAEPGMIALARNMLRSTANEFFDRYQEAWDEDRRLLFE